MQGVQKARGDGRDDGDESDRIIATAEQWVGRSQGGLRLLNNDKIDPGDIGAVLRKLTRQACLGHKLILCVQDDSDLSAVKIEGEQNLMHSTLAVTPDGKLLGVLGQRFVMRGEKHSKTETRKQRASRWKESDLWLEAG